jgi:ferredoxin
MKVTVDRDRCCGAGTCVSTAPAVFDQDEADGIVILLDPHPSGEDLRAARDAAGVCPAGVIELDESA